MAPDLLSSHNGHEHNPENPTPLPIARLLSVFLIQLSEPLTATVIYPFVNRLVRETGITAGAEEKTGYYAGIIVSLSFSCFISSIFSIDMIFMNRHSSCLNAPLACYGAICRIDLAVDQPCSVRLWA